MFGSSTITASAASLFDDNVNISLASGLTYNGSEQQLISDIEINNPDYWDNHELYIRIAKGSETGTWRRGEEEISGFAYADAGTYKIYAASVDRGSPSPGDNDGVHVGTVTIYKANATVTAANNLTYDGTEKELFTVSANSGEEIEFAENKAYEIIGRNDYTDLTLEEISSGKVYTPTGAMGIRFPEGYSIQLGQAVYKKENSDVVFNTSNGYYSIANHNLPNGTNAILIKEIKGTTIVVEAVNTATDFDEYKRYWQSTMPKATNAGTYNYWWRITDAKSKNYNYHAAEQVQATIGKATLKKGTELTEDVDYTAPTVNTETGFEYLFFKDEDRELIKAGSLRADINPTDAENTDKVKIEYGIETPTGKYNVYYSVFGGDNYKDTIPEYVTSKIDYKPIKLTLSNLGTVKVAEYDYATKEEKDVDADETTGQYELKASKTYKIYTEKSINEALETKYDLSRRTLKTGDYKYVYTITLPEVPDAEDYKNDAFTLSHTNNYHGKVLDSDQTKLYVADGGVTVTDDTTLAATLAGKNTYYYGDTPVVGDVNIRMTDLVQVKEIYLADATGAKVDLTSANVQYGEYNLTAILTIDNDGDNNFETTTGQLTETLRREVEFAPRPMSENTYYLKTTNNQGKETLTKLDKRTVYKKDADGKDTEEVDRYEVIVPADTYTYNSKDQKPEIVVKNPSLNKTKENPDGTALDIKSETADGEYTSAVTAHKDAGTYSEKITAVPSVTDEGGNVTTQANYTGDVTVVWTIKKATANVTVAAKEKIVYDGKNLDGDDFGVTAKETSPDELTKEFLSTIGKKDSGTTFEVSAAKGTVETKTDYTADDMTPANGVTVSYNNIKNNNNFVNKVINGNITLSFNTDVLSIGYLNVYVQNGLLLNGELVQSLGDYSGFSKGDVDNVNLTYDKTKGTLAVLGKTISAKPGYRLAIGSSSEGHQVGDDTYTNYINLYIVAVPEKKTTTEPKTFNIKDASVEGEVKKANVTIKSKNFEDIVYKQKLDDNGGVIADQDKSLTAKIKPLPVTITPKNIDNKPFVYGTFVANNDDGYFNCSYFNC